MGHFSLNRLFCFFILSGFFLTWTGVASAGDDLQFPLREKYPQVSPIETEELASIFDSAIIIDARNQMEFDVVHMVKAHNILVGKMSEEDLTKLRGKTEGPPLVFYCNGTTCEKSYKAADKAIKWGFSNVRCYDPGIFFWANKHPQRALFFGAALTPETVKTSFISKDQLAAVSLSTADFLAKANAGKYAIIDIRDPNERSENPIKLAKVKVLPFDTMVDQMTKKSPAVPRSGLLVFDNVGKQVDWLHYYLVKEGITDYFFLKGGVRQWLEDGYDASGVKK